MITIILNRKKCIGCSNCELINPFFFKISKIDGKSILLKSKKKKELFILKQVNNFFLKILKKTSKICPVKIIKIIKSN
ncbi:MAG: ferredoxin [Candidatus Shikimatogenerans bostrichidophilus]|nr:MAG: ferredoxin [Candidatus Shikimatogenerans bostrichidophilus]